MSTRAARFLESAASVMVILAASAVIYFVYSFSPAPPQSPKQPPLTKGLVVQAPEGADFRKHPLTAMVFIRSGCHFCSESMPFYRTILDQTRQDHETRASVVFVSTERPTITRSYLEGHDIHSEDNVVATTDLRPYPFVVSTPTLLVVDSEGRLVSGWRGRLTEDQQRQVLTTLGLNGSSARIEGDTRRAAVP
jgi:hypothetical protein